MQETRKTENLGICYSSGLKGRVASIRDLVAEVEMNGWIRGTFWRAF